MYLYARSIQADRTRGLDALAWAAEMCGTVSSTTGLEVHAWNVLYGAPITTITWTARVESHAEMGAAGEKLQADPAYVAKVEEAAGLFAGPPEDAFSEMVALVGDGGHDGEYAGVVTAQVAGGKTAEAMAWGVDILQHVGGTTGRDGIFLRSLYGPFGTVGWVTLASSLDQVEEANAAMAADPSYLGRIDGAGELFTPAATTSTLSRRIA